MSIERFRLRTAVYLLLIKVKDLLDVKENFITYKDQDAHNLIIIYFVEKVGVDMNK